VWAAERPHCPHCRSDAPYYARRCPTCREEFDWVPSPDEDSPWCQACASKPEVDALIARSKALGEAETISRLSKALELSEAAARAWWKSLEPGRCGWCGGSAKDPAGVAGECPVCFGSGACLGCDGDRRTHLGDERAARDRERMKRDLSPLRGDEYRRAFRERAEEYLRRHAGTLEATQIAIDPTVPNPGASPSQGPVVAGGQTAASVARSRVQRAIQALAP
jgi:hypothetical protein